MIQPIPNQSFITQPPQHTEKQKTKQPTKQTKRGKLIDKMDQIVHQIVDNIDQIEQNKQVE